VFSLDILFYTRLRRSGGRRAGSAHGLKCNDNTMEKGMQDRHYTEAELDALAQRLAIGETREPSTVSGHMQACARCRQKLEVLQQFYFELARDLNKPMYHRIEELSKAEPSNVIRLKPYRPQPDILGMGANENIHILAAQTTVADRSSVVLRATFASEPHKLLVRVLEDRDGHQYLLYILSEEKSLRSHTLIGIGTADALEFVATNADGVASLPSSAPVDWSNVSLVVLTPVAVFELSEGLRSDVQLSSGNIHLHATTRNNDTALSFTTTGSVGRVLLIFERPSCVVKKVSGGEVLLSQDEAREIRMIKLFP
ncbi:MAG: hypothetical protein AAB393_18090, partial [Bacteroidota bacterium]